MKQINPHMLLHELTLQEKELQECNDRLGLSYDRESRHAIAASALDEGVCDALELIENRVFNGTDRSALSKSVLLRKIQNIYNILSRAHARAAVEPESSIPLVVLGPGGDYTQEIKETDV